MRSRSLVVILVMGIGSVAAFGLLTKFAFENNAELKRVTEFKSNFLEAFEARGIEEVSFRWLPGNKGVLLRLAAAESRVRGSQYLVGDIAEFYVRRFPHDRYLLRIVFAPPSRFGCGEPSPYLKREMHTQAVRARMVAREQRQNLVRELGSVARLRLVNVKKRGRELEVVAALEGGPTETADSEALLEKAARAVLTCYSVSRLGRVRVSILSANGDSRVSGGNDGTTQPPEEPPSGGSIEPKLPAAKHEPVVLAEGLFDSGGRKVGR